eukprot:s762_g5.t1
MMKYGELINDADFGANQIARFLGDDLWSRKDIPIDFHSFQGFESSSGGVGGYLDERRRSKVAALVQDRGKSLRLAIEETEARCRGCRGERFLLSFLQSRFAAVYALAAFCQRLDRYCTSAAAAPKWCEQRAQESKEAVLVSARVFLCTIASTSRMLREWEEAMGSELHVHTVVVDECGCTPESSTALLLRLRPNNLVLVGDHKQLPPTSLVQPQILEGTGHNRSLLERCVLASGRVHQLREQYRMHPKIANVVSNLFYAGRLLTPSSVTQERQSQEARPLLWLDVQGREEAPNKSYLNHAEVAACVRVVSRLRERVGMGPSVAVLTFYKGQLEELMKAVPHDLDVEVLTVDACQGSEFDFVILSTVRANRELRLGFVKDAQRICVAASRSRLQLLVVGHRQTLSSDGDWRRVAEACSTPKPEEIQPQRALPATFVSVFDALRRAKEQEAEQKAMQAMEEQSKGGKGTKGFSQYGAEQLMRQQGSFRQAHRVTRRGRDAKMANLSTPVAGLSTPVAGMPEDPTPIGRRASFDQELKVSRRASSDKGPPKTPKNSGAASPVSDTPKDSPDQELKVSRRASSDKGPPKAPKSSGAASPVSDTTKEPKEPKEPKDKSTESSGFFLCWLCRRKFDSNEKFDLHVLHRRMGPTNPPTLLWPLAEASAVVEMFRNWKPWRAHISKAWRQRIRDAMARNFDIDSALVASPGSGKPGDMSPDRTGTTAWISVTASVCYAMSYFWRYPIFMLPPHILDAQALEIFGRQLSLQECFNMAFVVGFGAAKLPAMRLQTSAFFFQHRLSILLWMLFLSMILTGLAGLLPSHFLQVSAFFWSCFVSSFLYGGIVTYLEGRRSTEILLASISASLVFAGTVSRASAAMLLRMGCPARFMPLLLGAGAFLVAAFLLVLTARAPPPNRADVAARSARTPMSPR